jgi:HTH-type transcriptional regulator / antitoxin HipB
MVVDTGTRLLKSRCRDGFLTTGTGPANPATSIDSALPLGLLHLAAAPSGEFKMSDVGKYIAQRKKTDPEFAEGFEDGYREFKIGVLLPQAREEAEMTQEQLAILIRTKKTAISRLENHAEDIKLSTLNKVARALGKQLEVSLK